MTEPTGRFRRLVRRIFRRSQTPPSPRHQPQPGTHEPKHYDGTPAQRWLLGEDYRDKKEDDQE